VEVEEIEDSLEVLQDYSFSLLQVARNLLGGKASPQVIRRTCPTAYPRIG
jgi:hypothetical protein